MSNNDSSKSVFTTKGHIVTDGTNSHILATNGTLSSLKGFNVYPSNTTKDKILTNEATPTMQINSTGIVMNDDVKKFDFKVNDICFNNRCINETQFQQLEQISKLEPEQFNNMLTLAKLKPEHMNNISTLSQLSTEKIKSITESSEEQSCSIM